MDLIEINLPQYTVESEPDTKAIGKIVDDELKKHFMGKSVLIRGIASSEHPGKSVDELIDIIKKTGTDRYDTKRKGDRYENIENKRIDLFAFPLTVGDSSEIFDRVVWGFYHSAREVHGYPMRIDVVTVYDATQMHQVFHQYEERDDVKDDGFAFKDLTNKQSALLGVVRIN